MLRSSPASISIMVYTLQQYSANQLLRSSIVSTKGLLNGPGQNNCFLNCAVQVRILISSAIQFFVVIVFFLSLVIVDYYWIVWRNLISIQNVEHTFQFVFHKPIIDDNYFQFMLTYKENRLYEKNKKLYKTRKKSKAK